MRTIFLCLLPLILAGCINIAVRTQPEQTDVPAVRASSDCAPIIFGLGFGTATLEGALAEPVIRMTDPYDAPRQPIRRIRSVAIGDYQFLFFGARCVEIVGE